MKHVTKTLVALTLLAALCCSGLSNAATDPYDTFVEQVAKLSELLDRAAYLSMLGFSGYGGEEEQLSLAQGLVNLFEGSSGANYWALDTGSTGSELGILGIYNLLYEFEPTLWRGFRIAVEREGGSRSSDDTRVVLFFDALSTSGQFVDTAYSHSLHALSDVKDDVVFGELRETGPGGIPTFEGAERFITGHGETFRTIYASIVAARGGFDDPFLVPGIRQVAEMVPSREVWLTPSDNIQDAIHSLPDGGTIHLEAGVYRQRVEIYKSLTLVGAASQDIPTGETTIEGVEWQGAISIMDDMAISVAIEGLTIRGSSTAIAVGASYGAGGSRAVSVDLKNVRFEDNGVALTVDGDATILCSECTFIGDRSYAIRAFDESRVEVRDCLLIGGSGSMGTIQVLNDAVVSMDRCTMEDPSGVGILLVPTASLHLTECSIQGSYAPSIAIAELDNGSPVTGELESECGFGFTEEWGGGTTPGEITGYGNKIHGSFCPTTLRFLNDPEPEGE